MAVAKKTTTRANASKPRRPDTKLATKPKKATTKISEEARKKLRSAARGNTHTKPIVIAVSFEPGTDMAVAFEEALKGGASRAEVVMRLKSKWLNHRTRNNRPKPVSTILNYVLRKALANGYVIEQHWRLIKPEDPAPAIAPVKASRRTRVS